MHSLGSLCRLIFGGGILTAAALENDITISMSPPRPVPAPLQRILEQNVDSTSASGVSEALFSELERLARLVDIAYCVGTTGISPPFSCVSRCHEFPSVQLVTAWNTGALLTDSCGYVAVDHAAEADATGRQDWQAPGAVIVAFRGTYSITNTVIDLSTVPQEYVPYPEPEDGDSDGHGNDGGDRKGGSAATKAPRQRCDNCTVHMGFLASWRSARGLVLPAVRDAKKSHPNYTVHLVGHSLGGAVAALAALELRLVEGWDDIVVTTFGEPRVGNQGLADFIDDVFSLRSNGENQELEAEGKGNWEGEFLPYRRVTHAGDPVPLLPLSEWGYRAHAGEIYIEKTALPPSTADLRLCRGAHDPACSDPAGDSSSLLRRLGKALLSGEFRKLRLPARLKLWQLFFAHRDYFWRLGLCVPGGDPADWGRDKYRFASPDRQDEL